MSRVQLQRYPVQVLPLPEPAEITFPQPNCIVCGVPPVYTTMMHLEQVFTHLICESCRATICAFKYLANPAKEKP